MIYVHPAGHESFGLSIAEAMSCGLPVITTRRRSYTGGCW